MQDSSPFQFIAIDHIDESTTNPRQTFDATKLDELATSIIMNGVIQPIVVRPHANRFEVVAGARRFRASVIAEQFSIPARVVELNDAQAVEWQLVENSQREDVHPYEEAQGFQRLLDMPGYDVAAIALKSGKSASHIYARLSLLQLIPEVAKAFVEERITASHANLIARLQQEHQADAFANCWRKDWKDEEAHLLPAKHLSAWIQSNLYLDLEAAPFDKDDPTLNPSAGSCFACPRRSGYNTSLFADVQGDQCLDAACFQGKITAHLDRELAARPELVQIETAWRNPKDQRPGALNRNDYRELPDADNPDAEPPCAHAKPALIVFGKGIGRTVMVCLEPECSVHSNQPEYDDEEEIAAAPAMPPAPEEETEEEAAQRIVEHEQRVAEYEAEETRKREERKAAVERLEQEREAERVQRERHLKARAATFERILANAPEAFNAAQLRTILSLLIHLDPYDYLDKVMAFYTKEDENTEQSVEQIVSSVLGATPDEKLTSFALRLLLSDHVAIPQEDQPDLLAEAEQIFAPEQLKTAKPKKAPTTKPALIKAAAKGKKPSIPKKAA
ncbi:ParB/RepB/Spo0J family partition protein [Granulicella cerasi]|uniref:ParB/RepB/Spo0J family partition protein n=1 Tax=Granulicella cerasi TaxID=741063 RepID=A0ABW1ZEP5_9BACT|nr:ParB/RepB/Spo0J family partition protein [Granulicella cerasi]